MKTCVKIFAIAALILMLTSCWNNRDLTELAILTGIAIDKSEDKKVQITVQIVKPEEMKHSQENGAKSRAYVNISSEGETMFEAARNLLSKINKKAYFAHVQLFVMSEEAAKEGLSYYFDLFERDTETRRRMDLIIAKGMKARTVLERESQLTKLPSTHDVEALDASDALGKTLKITLIEVLKNSNKEGYCPVLPVIYGKSKAGELYQEDLIKEGSAIIKKDRLIGFLEASQTRGYLFAKNKIKSTIINVPAPTKEGRLVSIEIIRSTGKIEAKMKRKKPFLSIEVLAEGNIGEQLEKADLTKEDTLRAIEERIQAEIKKEIMEAVQVTQEKFQSDIWGFIDELYKNHYKEWKEVVSDWDSIYSNTPINVNVKFELRRSGLITKPVEVR